MTNILKVLNSVQSHLITWGDPFDCNGKDVIICITGNPGVTDFYIEFGTNLHKSTGVPVCVVGHAGHEEVPDKKSNQLKGQEKLFNLEGQIEHKLDLICNYIDKHSRLHLIGHSIGSWIILEALQQHTDLIQRVASINLLFPTIQNMAKTKNGIFLNNFVRRFHMAVLLLFTFAYVLPELIKSLLVNIYLKLKSLPPHYKDRIYKYCNPIVGEKVLFLAYDEMDRVKSLNTNIINKIKHITNVIYSEHDDWAPVSYIEDLISFQPSLQMKKVKIDHAFVLKSSEIVAEMVSDYIKLKLS